MVHGYKYKLTQTISPKPTFAHSFPHNVFFLKTAYAAQGTQEKKKTKQNT
jgi:hypothetical protein